MSPFRLFRICCLAFVTLQAARNPPFSHAADENSQEGRANANSVENFARLLEEYESRKSLDLLDKALRVVEQSPHLSREKQVRMWLLLILVAERGVDPTFDPNDFPQLSIVPPREASGVRMHSGVRPEGIRDPKARAEYEEALKKNDEKGRRFNFQMRLRFLCDNINKESEWRIKRLYNRSDADQQELRHILDESGISEAQKHKLKVFFNKGQTK